LREVCGLNRKKASCSPHREGGRDSIPIFSPQYFLFSPACHACRKEKKGGRWELKKREKELLIPALGQIFPAGRGREGIKHSLKRKKSAYFIYHALRPEKGEREGRSREEKKA